MQVPKAIRLFLTSTALLTSTARANDYLPDGERADESPYVQGRTRLGIGGDSDYNGNRWNMALAFSLGYFVVDNLELGGELAFQFGDDPFSAQLGPSIRYFMPVSEVVHPYLGAFYRHYFLTAGIDDLDTLGARLGLIWRQGATFLGFGVVFEHIISACDDECTEIYPEVGLSVLF